MRWNHGIIIGLSWCIEFGVILPLEDRGTSQADQMLDLKTMAKRIPGLRSAVGFARRRYAQLAMGSKPGVNIFTDVFRENKWGGIESFSGKGSDLLQTTVIRRQLPLLCREFEIRSMLDIPCGDFNWMKHVDLGTIAYTGADVVGDLIAHNSRYETSNTHFCSLNLLKHKLPKVDLVFCRDCLVHFSFRDSFAALRNICESGSTYLLTTTFTSHRRNHNIPTGSWHPLNLEYPPFSFPPPLKLINEECTQSDGTYMDKSLGLWNVADIGACLKKSFTDTDAS